MSGDTNQTGGCQCGRIRYRVNAPARMLYAYPMLRLFVETPEGEKMLGEFPRLLRWIEEMQKRPSVRTTSFHWSRETADGF